MGGGGFSVNHFFLGLSVNHHSNKKKRKENEIYLMGCPPPSSLLPPPSSLYQFIPLLLFYKLLYTPFHETIPKSSAFVSWISVRFYETDCIIIYLQENMLMTTFKFLELKTMNILGRCKSQIMFHKSKLSSVDPALLEPVEYSV